MATTLTLLSSNPYAAVFAFASTDNAAVLLKRSGAAAPDVNISVLTPGPLRSFLQRTDVWASNASPMKDRVRITIVNFPDGSSPSLRLNPIPNPTVALGLTMIGNGNAELSFSDPAGATTCCFEIRFLHSMNR
jgi:hypothetical protein